MPELAKIAIDIVIKSRRTKVWIRRMFPIYTVVCLLVGYKCCICVRSSFIMCFPTIPCPVLSCPEKYLIDWNSVSYTDLYASVN